MSGDERRGAPQYGEYATPDEVRAALGQPEPPDPAERPEPEPPNPATRLQPEPPNSEAPPVARPRPWDRVLTIVLLVLGLLYLIGSISSLLSLDVYLERSYRDFLDVDVDFGAPTRVIGQAMLVAVTVVLGISAMAALRRLRTGRLAFWIALVGAAATFAVIVLGTILVMLLEPSAFTASLG